ncbi:unnamed protein product [Hermetia illucens]|uniref:Uncharacterized protein n=1 Tax=Hermetia illucens TaxID=343691 RepID=A0A7R8UIC0_HERIL|nr:uncharacterized protein LOC119647780 [Hermetia illucens]CAD7081169.1 unnamed protein product [Hermetia illucens]
MFWLIRFALLLAVFAQLKLSLGRRDFSVVFDACEVLETTKFCDMNCSISDSKRVTYYWNILERASKYGFGIKMFGKTSGLKEHVKIFEHSVDDICPLLSKSKSGNIFLLILDELKKYAKLPKCPVEKDTYHLKDYSFPAERLPAYAPEGEFLLIFDAFGYAMNGTYHKFASYSLKCSIQSKLNPFRNKKGA